MILEPAVQHVGVHAMLEGQGGNRGAGLLACGQQFGLELRAIGTARARHRVARGLRVFEHRVHAGFVDTISLNGRGRIKMGSPVAYAASSEPCFSGINFEIARGLLIHHEKPNSNTKSFIEPIK